ncbi:MAG: helix-turn-helix domain-containing protein [Caldisericia bacterium]
MKTVKQVAEEFQCSVFTIYRLIKKKKIRAIKFNRSLRILEEEIERIKKEGI